MNAIIAGAILIGGIGFAWWFMNRSSEQRAARQAEMDREEQQRIASQFGLPAGIRPLCPAGDNCLAQQALDDGEAHNSKWVDNDFRVVYWREMDAGKGIGQSMKVAMEERQWRLDSREQVLERLKSKNLISQSDKDTWLREYRAEGIPDGFGRFS